MSEHREQRLQVGLIVSPERRLLAGRVAVFHEEPFSKLAECGRFLLPCLEPEVPLVLARLYLRFPRIVSPHRIVIALSDGFIAYLSMKGISDVPFIAAWEHTSSMRAISKKTGVNRNTVLRVEKRAIEYCSEPLKEMCELVFDVDDRIDLLFSLLLRNKEFAEICGIKFEGLHP